MVEHSQDLIRPAAAGTLPCLDRGGLYFRYWVVHRQLVKIAATRIMLSAYATCLDKIEALLQFCRVTGARHPATLSFMYRHLCGASTSHKAFVASMQCGEQGWHDMHKAWFVGLLPCMAEDGPPSFRPVIDEQLKRPYRHQMSVFDELLESRFNR